MTTFARHAVFGVALLAFLAGCDRSSQRALATAEAPAPDAGPRAVQGGIEFTLTDPAAQSVHLAGSFNGWSTSADPLVKDAQGRWRIVKALPPGSHQYKFVLNGGQTWKQDPENPNGADDGFGGKNSVVEVGPGGKPAAAAAPATGGGTQVAPAGGPRLADGKWVFTYDMPDAQSVHLAGSFNGWSTSADPMAKDAAGRWTIARALPAGTHQYKFAVNGGQQWKEDPSNPNASDDGYGGKNSVLVVP